MIDGPPPYPGFNGCFLMYASNKFVFIWVLLLVWDARKCKYILLNVPPLIEKVVLLILMLVPAVRACEKSWFWSSVKQSSYSQY
jgi:hypothetical protein